MRHIIVLFSFLVLFLPFYTYSNTDDNARSSNPAATKQGDVFIPLKAGEYDEAYDNYMIGNYFTAFTIALQRGEKGDPTAQTLLGRLYAEGNAVPLDGARAALWFGRAAKQGDPQAELRYGLILFNGDYVTRNQQEGENFIRKAVKAGVPEAYFYYGQLLMNKADDDDVLEIGLSWFLKGAALGNPDSAFAASQILARGTPKRAKDDNSARKLMEAAASKNHVPAQINLAKWLIEGRGGLRDYKAAFNLLLLNAAKMIAPAQINLARLYRDGIGTGGNTVKAAAWYFVAKETRMEAPDLESMLEGMSQKQLQEAHSIAISLIPTL